MWRFYIHRSGPILDRRAVMRGSFVVAPRYGGPTLPLFRPVALPQAGTARPLTCKVVRRGLRSRPSLEQCAENSICRVFRVP
jgi:hypothetical protein